jgi:hypothetical protein
MSIPGFTAEEIQGRVREQYTLTQSVMAGAERVLPQFFCFHGEGGTTCFQCWDEGGSSGCIPIHIPHRVLF